MVMFTEDAMKKVEDAMLKKKQDSKYTYGLGVEAHNGASGAGIYINDVVRLCDLEDLEQLIDELIMVKEALAEEVGIIC